MARVLPPLCFLYSFSVRECWRFNAISATRAVFMANIVHSNYSNLVSNTTNIYYAGCNIPQKIQRAIICSTCGEYKSVTELAILSHAH